MYSRQGFRLAIGVVLVLAVLSSFPVRAAESPTKLRHWHIGLNGAGTWRSRYDVFGVPSLPAGEVENRGRGASLLFGYRFGDRFLLGVQVATANHDIADSDTRLTDAEALLTGTVLFRSRATLQPFLRGGFGGAGEFLSPEDGSGYLVAVGTAAVAGGGFQVRLGSRVSLEWEYVSTFANFLEVADRSVDTPWPEDSWQVRVSNWGWRSGVGIMIWF